MKIPENIEILEKVKKNILSWFYIPRNDIKLILFCLSVIIILDLTSKYFIFNMKFDGYYIISFLNILKVKNHGISFGLFGEYRATAIYFIIIFDFMTMLYLLHCFQMKNTYKYQRFFVIAVCLIFGGAAGNVFDRVCYGYVRDFIDFHLGKHHWPCFNIADICICVGTAMFAACELFFKKHK